MASPIPPSPVQRSLIWLKAHAYLLFAPLVSLLLFFVLQRVPFFELIENKTVDQRFQLREKYDQKADPHLVLIDVDEASLTRQGRWPWPRSVHGTFLQLLTLANPAVVGWDVLFTESSRENPKGDLDLAEGAKVMAPVVTGAILDPEGNGQTGGLTEPIPNVKGDISKIGYHSDNAKFPYPGLESVSIAGFVDSHPDKLDGIRRTLPLVVRTGDKVYASLVTQLLIQYWKITPADVEVVLGKEVVFHLPDHSTVRVPTNEKAEIPVNYRNKKAFTELPYWAAMSALAKMATANASWPPKYPSLEGKILLVGENAEGLTDMGPSPLEPISALVMTHLNALNNILQGDYLRQPSEAWIFIWLGLGWLLVAYPTLWLARNTPVLVSVALPLVIAAIYLLAIDILFARYSLVLPAVWPVAAFILIHFGAIVIRWLEEQQSKQAIKAVFGSFVSSNVMNQLLKSPENVKLGGDSKPVTIFFSDIRGFSTFAEGMTDQELITQLNEYFVRMVNRVIVNDGTLHKFIGDAVMAVWGDVLPSDLALDAKKAVRASLEMRRELAELNKLRKERGLFDFKIGMGLNHGTVVVGNIGAEGQKLEFTVIGDPVNLASRLEGVTKQYHTDLVIGESVRAFLGDEFLLRTIGLLVVKGKTQPVRAFEVIDEVGKPPTTDFDPAWVHAYEEGFNWYLERKFPEAAARFEECLAKRPGDYCCEIYLEEAKALIAEPPGPEWKGVSKLDSK